MMTVILEEWVRLYVALRSINDVVIVAGGVIPEQDYDYLYSKGVDFIFGPGTVIAKAALDILNKF